jgi:lambda family phage portal protein
MSEKKKQYPNMLERAVYFLSPEKGSGMFLKRLRKEQEIKTPADTKTGGEAKMAVSGYGRHGASTTLNSLIGWLTGGGSAEDDIDVHGALLRERSRDLVAGGGLARSGINAMVTSVIGWGVQPKPKIDKDFLKLSDEAADAWEAQALREWKLWAENTMCDAERQQTFYDMQQLAYRSQLTSGDVFALFEMKENKRTPYQTAIRLLEADRISTPESSGGESEIKELENGGRIVDGVEINKQGEVTKYHITNRHPLKENTTEDTAWQPIDAFGKDTGYPNILHIYVMERPEQRRGVPFVSAQIEQIKQFDRYNVYELAANVVAAMLAVFITSDEDNGQHGMEHAVDEADRVTDDDLHLELAPGAVYSLPPGKKVNILNPIRQNSAYKDFVETQETIIGSSMEIPKEVLIKKYDSNYTAARASLLDFWRTVRVHRTRFNASFNQPIYEQWLAEAVASGRIEAPGFFDDPAIRQAWCGCMWTGVSMGHVDPLKEVNAAAMRIQQNITTQEQEASEYNGNDWDANIRQRRKEAKAIQDLLSLVGDLDAPNIEEDKEEKDDA